MVFLTGNGILISMFIGYMTFSQAATVVDLLSMLRNTNGNPINRTKLFSLSAAFYVIPQICDVQKPEFSHPFLNEQDNQKCSCEWSCVKRKTCCFDNPYAAITPSSFNAVIYPPNARFRKDIRMVTECELKTSTYASLCNSNRESLAYLDVSLLPVTSNRSFISYRNMYCALCYLEKEIHLLYWELTMFCRNRDIINKTDIFSENSISFLKDRLREEQCVIAFHLNSNDTRVEEITYQNSEYIESCNVTGLWSYYDADIDWACIHFEKKYLSFKNIFCYICNPSLVSKQSLPIFDNCNNSDSASKLDSRISVNCESSPSETRWYPLKNVFCYMCNNPTFLTGFKSVKYSIQEYFDNKNKTFETGVYFNYLPPYGSSNGSISSFLRGIYMNACNTDPVCHDCDISETGMSCDDNSRIYCICSSPACSMPTKCCKRNIRETDSVTCASDTLAEKPSYSACEKSYMSISKCYGSNVMMNDKCENPNTADIYQVLPAFSLNGLIFRNLYCSHCNDDYHSLPYRFVVKCKTYVEARLMPTLQKYFQLAVNEQCSFKINERVECQKTPDRNARCNSTGLWKVGNERIRKACESNVESIFAPFDITVTYSVHLQFSGFKNIYCYICNPTDSSPLYKKCNQTGQSMAYDRQTENLCYTGRHEPQWGPFKNRYCLLCNVPGSFSDEIKASMSIFDFVLQPSYKELFRLEPRIFKIFTAASKNELCTYGSIDQKTETCVPLFCAEGKILYNDYCEYPLDSDLNDTKYHMYISLEIASRNSVPISAANVKLQDISDFIKTLLSTEMEKSGVNISYTSIALWTNSHCDEHSIGIASKKSPIYAFISFTSTFRHKNVLLIEELLLKEREYFISTKDVEITLKTKIDFTLYFLLNNATNMAESGCLFRENYPLSERDIFKFVSDLLTCVQMKLDLPFQIDNLTMEVFMLSNNLTLHAFQFKYTSDTEIRVCKDVLTQIKMNSKSVSLHAPLQGSIEYIFAVYTLMCTSFSVLCLFLTLLTYGTHEELRTRPGKLNMCLIISLMFAQITLQFGLHQTHNQNICMIIGILIHVAWLITFFSYSVAIYNFHKTFNSSLATMNALSTDRSVPFYYFLYTIGVPVAIVIGNLSYHMAVYNMKSYGYGGSLCFISEFLPTLITFFLPILAIIFSNTVLFAVAFYKLRKSSTLRRNQDKYREFVVFVRLFTITGIAWLLEIADASLNMIPLSFICTGIDGLQGVFVFLSFVCNRRVISLYKAKLKKGQ